MIWVRDRQSIMPQRSSRQLLVVLILAIAITSVVVGCSTATRHRIKTIVFTGVPPLHGEASAEQTEQGETPKTAAAEQMCLWLLLTVSTRIITIKTVEVTEMTPR